MGRAGMGSTHHEWPAGVARRRQSGQHPVCPANAQRRDVLNNDPSRAALVDQPLHVPPQATAQPVQPGPGARNADVLAWETAADEIRPGNAVLLHPAGRQHGDVVVAGHPGPMAPQDGAGERRRLTEGDGAEAGPLETEAEPADAAEQVKDAHKSGLGINA